MKTRYMNRSELLNKAEELEKENETLKGVGRVWLVTVGDIVDTCINLTGINKPKYPTSFTYRLDSNMYSYAKYEIIGDRIKQISDNYTFTVEDDCIVDTEIKQKPRPMTRVEIMLKAMDIHKQNEKLIDSLWLVTQGNNHPCFPLDFTYTYDNHSYSYAKYNLQGEQISEKYKFEIEEH